MADQNLDTATSDLTVSNLFNFRNHVVLVTGGATGLGEMAAQAYVQNGAKVIIASRKESELKKTSERLQKLGPGTCSYVIADLKDKAGCDHLVVEVKKLTNRLTVLINNTGATWGGKYEDFPENGWDKLMALNVKSIFYVTVGLQPLLLNGASHQTPARVINIASVAGLQTIDVTVGEEGGLAEPGTGTFSYGPSKAACVHLSKMQASKLAPLNIMVNCICPGVFPSRMTRYGFSQHHEALVAGQPTGRVGQPTDFGGLVLFLGSLAGAHMTGTVLEIDGGATVSGWRGKRKAAAREKL